MIILTGLLITWLAINVVCCMLLTFIGWYDEDESTILIYPYLIYCLREKLNITGTIITIILFSVFFAPALIIYFTALCLLAICYFSIKGFIKIFERKN